jgi:hypothetical protein
MGLETWENVGGQSEIFNKLPTQERGASAGDIKMNALIADGKINISGDAIGEGVLSMVLLIRVSIPLT